MSVDETLMCSFQILKSQDKKTATGGFSHLNGARPGTPNKNKVFLDNLEII